MHPTDGHSNKSHLMPPTPGEVAKLAQLSRTVPPETIAREKQAAPPRNLRRRLSPQAIDELKARYTPGEKTPALSREFGISESGCRDLLRSEGVSLRGHPITPEDAEKAVLLYAGGLTITQVVKEVGYSHNTIRTALLKDRVVVRERSGGNRASSRRVS